MGYEQTFLQRIADLGAHRRSSPTTAEDAEALVESVRDHLMRLLNARHGMSEGLADYGLPSLTDLTMGGGDHVQTIRDAIRVAIEKYEPRLRRVRVLPVQEEAEAHRQTLSFRIEATLVGRSGEHRVWYETALSGAGEFEVAG